MMPSTNFGALLATGIGTRQSYEEAALWFQRAAEQGHGSAQHRLGNLYLQGMGVPRDKHRMMQWWRKAAIQGNVSANMPWVRPITTATC